MLSQLCTGLCEFLNIDPIEPRDGVYEIVFDGGLPIEILSLTDSQFLIRSELAQLPDNRDEWRPVIHDYLSGNMLLLREQSNTLSLDQDSAKIWLHRMGRFDDISVYEFCELVSQFVTTLEWWDNRTNSAKTAPTSAMDLMPQNFIRP